MDHLFLSTAVLCSALLSITATAFNKHNKSGFSYLYNLIVTASSFLVWLISFINKPEFSAGVIVYSIIFGLFYVVSFIGVFHAMSCGSPSLTAFMKPLSLIIVSLWGVLFWNNPISPTLTVGLVLVVVSLWLCFKPNGISKTSGKWFLFAIMLIVGNAGCSLAQKYQQIRFAGEYGNFLMLGATGASVIFCLFICLTGERPKACDVNKRTLHLPAVAGLSSALLNICVLRLISSPIPESVFFPIIGVGGVMLAVLFSVAVYKEKLALLQWVGLCIGVIAIAFLNI